MVQRQHLVTLFIVIIFGISLPLSVWAIDISPMCGEKKAAETIPDPAQLLSAAEQGDIEAQAKLGAAFLSGIGIEKNEDQGIAWLKKAADRNSRTAQSVLGGHYFDQAGRGVGDFALAFSLLDRAAAQGDSWAEWRLSALYFRGVGVAQDLKKARALLTKSAESGLPFAQYFLGLELRGPMAGEDSANYYGFEIDPQSSFTWMKRAADSGNCIAVVMLAWSHVEGMGTKRNSKEARRILEAMHARGGEGAPFAAYTLGEMYADEKLGMKDVKLAIRWLEIAAQARLPEAEKLLDKLREAKRR